MGLPKPGEKSVQETFTDEWNRVQGDELSFLYSPEDLRALNKKVWLKWLAYPQNKVNNVLNIGCGLGRESEALQQVTNNAEVFAVDLNFAVLRSGERLKSNPKIHLVVASLFHLPFELASFDLVYSQGVVMATFSTWEAIKSIASYVRNDGFMFIWVYGLDDHLLRKGAIGFLTRTNYLVEKGLRPLISGSPKVLRDIFFTMAAFVLHPLIKSRVRHKATWKVSNTDHDLRDWLSPRYAHRHSYNEVFEWFENLGFTIIDVQSPAAFRQLFQKQLWGVGLTGKRLEQ
jgi:SAM-dependent methyltransferase